MNSEEIWLRKNVGFFSLFLRLFLSVQWKETRNAIEKTRVQISRLFSFSFALATTEKLLRLRAAQGQRRIEDTKLQKRKEDSKDAPTYFATRANYSNRGSYNLGGCNGGLKDCNSFFVGGLNELLK